MPEQLALTGFEAPRPTSDRLFFAILPDAQAIARIDRLVHELSEEHALRGKPLGRERFHVSLHHVGDFAGLPQDVVDAACALAETVTTTAPFELRFDRVASFTRKSHNMPLVLLGDAAVLALTGFQHALAAAMAGAGLGRAAGSHFNPHLTLLYDDRRVAERAIEPIGWTAGEFVLVRSLIGRSRHELLARLPLRG